MGRTKNDSNTDSTFRQKRPKMSFLPPKMRRKKLGEMAITIQIENGPTVKFMGKPTISPTKILRFHKDCLQPFFANNNMILSKHNGYVCCDNPRTQIHIFAPGTCLECVYMVHRSGLRTKNYAKNKPRVYEACFKCSVDEFDYLSHSKNPPQIKCVMMGCDMGRNIPQKFSPKWHSINDYKVNISNVRLDTQKKLLCFKFVIHDMNRALNIQKMNNVTNTWETIRTVKNSILYLLDFFVEIKLAQRNRKYFVEFPFVFKKGSPRKKKGVVYTLTACKKFAVDQYRPRIGSEKAQAQRLMNFYHNQPTVVRLKRPPMNPMLLPKIRIMMPRKVSANQVILPSFSTLLNHLHYKKQFN